MVPGATRGSAVACLLMLMIPLGGAQTGPADAETLPDWTTWLPPALLAAPGEAAALPDAPQDALRTAVDRFHALLGTDPASSQTLADAAVPDALAGRVALLLDALRACTEATRTLLEGLGDDPVAASADAVPGDPRGQAVQDCFDPVWSALLDLELELQASQTAFIPSLDLWPVLRWEGHPTLGHQYDFDYVLQIDGGGDDVYNNNAGSNLIDLKHPPLDPWAPPARGCEEAIPGITNADCTPVAAVLLDQRGDDTYGIFQSPGVDSRCTDDPVVRRMMTGAAGFAGVGVLRDLGGNDAYNGKTVSLGAGHVFGVGVLWDEAGHDTYRSVRNSQGFGLVGGFGALLDHSGSDDYGWYMPSAKTPGSDPLQQQDGSGGVVDDEGRCDSIPRLVQGAGSAGGVGVLLDNHGSDRYVGATVSDFAAPVVGGRAASQGFGIFGGAGVLVDSTSDGDSYEGVDGRHQNELLLPGDSRTGASQGLGLFLDNRFLCGLECPS